MKDGHLKPPLYFGAPLFSAAELSFNQNLCDQLSDYFDVYLPQRDGGLLVDLIRRGVQKNAAYSSIFDRDLVAIRESNVFLIVLDGRAIDEGASFELGIAFALNKLCIGLQTDSRRLLPIGNNPMIECAVKDIFASRADLLQWAERYARSAHPSA